MVVVVVITSLQTARLPPLLRMVLGHLNGGEEHVEVVVGRWGRLHHMLLMLVLLLVNHAQRRTTRQLRERARADGRRVHQHGRARLNRLQ